MYGLIRCISVCCACDPSVHLDIPSIGLFVLVYVERLSTHIGVRDLGRRCFLSSCCFFL